ncbi:MAG: T9SS type A sorting domain-containing protein [Ginsengibacter sp.]
MRTKSLLFLSIIATTTLLKAQKLPSFTHDADSVFQNLNKNNITTGILYDRIYPYAMLHVFNTGYFDTSNLHHFRQAYYELYNAKYNKTDLKKPQAVDKEIATIKETGKVPIGIINFEFNQIDTNALKDNLLENRNGIYYDVLHRSKSPYWEKQISILSPLVDSTEGLQINFQTSSTLYLQNTGHAIQSLQANFNNGSGFINIGLNNTITINYPSYGKKIIKFIIKYQDNTEVTTYAYLKLVKPEETVLNTGTPCDKNGYVNATIPFTDYENNTFKGQGNIRYYFATNHPCNGKVKKPIIILDGFDPGDTRSIKQLYNIYLNNPDRYEFADEMRRKGYDIVILNFPTYTNELGNIVDGGADYIERNAFVLVKLIDKLNQELKENNSNEQLVIIGPSMGGLISRYALAYMEKNNMPHNTRLWISLDAPHNGANVPIGAQKYLEFFAGNGVENAEETLTQQLNNPAAKQQLLHHYLSYSDSAKGAPGFRDRFVQALASNGVAGSQGFPLIPRKIALVDGSLNGTLQSNAAACQLALTSKTYLSIKIFLIIQLLKVAEGNISFAGSYGNSCTVLSADQLFEGSTNVHGYAPAPSVSYDIAPGGFRTSLFTLADDGGGYSEFFQFLFESIGTSTDFTVYNGSHSFIPTKSALAFRGDNQDLAESVYNRNLVCTGETPFDTYYGSTENLEHSFIDSPMAKFAISEIQGKHQKPSYDTSVANACDTGGSPGMQYVQVNNCGFTMKIIPNPSQGNIYLKIEQTQSLKTCASFDQIHKLEIIDRYGRIRKKFSYASGETGLKINLSDLENGTYIIHVFNGTVWDYKQVIIFH